MGHHSHLVVGDHLFFYTRDHYVSELVALFTESERQHTVSEEEPDEVKYGYFTTAYALRQRLHVQGFTSARARADLDEGVLQWRKAYDDERELRESDTRRGEEGWHPRTREPRQAEALIADFGMAVRQQPPPETVRRRLAPGVAEVRGTDRRHHLRRRRAPLVHGGSQSGAPAARPDSRRHRGGAGPQRTDWLLREYRSR